MPLFHKEGIHIFEDTFTSSSDTAICQNAYKHLILGTCIHTHTHIHAHTHMHIETMRKVMTSRGERMPQSREIQYSRANIKGYMSNFMKNSENFISNSFFV